MKTLINKTVNYIKSLTAFNYFQIVALIGILSCGGYMAWYYFTYLF